MSDDGGQAFPFVPNQQLTLPDGTWDQNTDFGDPGMSLRDYYAGMAMHASLSVPVHHSLEDLAAIVRGSWLVADAMIAEKRRRERKNDEQSQSTEHD